MPFTTSRYRMLAGALLSLLVVVGLTVLYKADLHGLDGLDNELGSGPQGWTFRHPAADSSVVEVVFDDPPDHRLHPHRGGHPGLAQAVPGGVLGRSG